MLEASCAYALLYFTRKDKDLIREEEMNNKGEEAGERQEKVK